jgi:hypothetical protein
MKTTVHIPDPVLRDLKEVARREGTTVKALIEEGARGLIAGRRRSRPFRLRKASFGGKGLQEGVQEGSWERIREMIYEGRGG